MLEETIKKIRNDFMERLKRVIIEYTAIAEKLETGNDKVYRTSRFGGKEDVSLQTADHYRRLVSHYKEIVARHEAKKK
jgi:DNA invertase Pin-like site-specific DNA recombinase